MVTTTWQGIDDGWNDPNNWTAGVPLGGDIAVISPEPADQEPIFNGTLFDLTVQIKPNALLSGTFLSLSDTTIQDIVPGAFAQVMYNTLDVPVGSAIETIGSEKSQPAMTLSGTNLNNSGFIAAEDNATLDLDVKNVANQGDIAAYGGTVFLGSGTTIGGHGTLTIGNGGYFIIGAGAAVIATNKIQFNPATQNAGGVLEVVGAVDLSPRIWNFTEKDTIEFFNFTANGMSETYNAATNTSSDHAHPGARAVRTVQPEGRLQQTGFVQVRRRTRRRDLFLSHVVTGRASSPGLLRRQELRHRQVAFAGVVVEPQHGRARRQLRQLLGDRGERRARTTCPPASPPAGRPAAPLARLLGLHLDHPVDRSRCAGSSG